MIVSMTGFGTATALGGDRVVIVEVRTANHRFLDMHIRLAKEYAFLEAEIQQAVRSLIARGRVDVSVTIQTTGPASLLIDAKVARAYWEAAARLRDEFHLTDCLDLRTLLMLPGIVQNRDPLTGAGEEGNGLPEVVRESLHGALQSVLKMRRQEGEVLQSEMLRYLDSIQDKRRAIQRLIPATVEEYRLKLGQRLAQLLPQMGIDPQRLAQEAALLVERADVSEEVARLESHLGQFSELVQAGKEVGKKMDFLLQEMQREVNTILSKTGNLEMTRLGLATKADIEKLREQAQNIE